MSNNEKAILVNKCIDSLYNIYNENNGLKVLVCSDSATFLNEARKLNFVYVVDGYDDSTRHIRTEAHMVDDKTVIKLLTDLFLMSYSDQIYSVNNEEMYKGNFAKTSALIGGKNLLYVNI